MRIPVPLRGRPVAAVVAVAWVAAWVAAWTVPVVGLCLSPGCEKAAVSYRPPIVPVHFTVGGDGHISVGGDTSLVTPIGLFSVGAEYALKDVDDTIVVKIRTTRNGADMDDVYRVKSGGMRFTAVVDGQTTIQVVNNEVLVDVTRGSVKTIELKEVAPPPAAPSRWHLEPCALGYKPFSFCRAVYDDSTIGRWYGIGFVWFLIRLIGAIFALILDVILTVVLGFGAVLHTVFGVTVRNIYFGLVCIFGLLIGVAVIADS